VLFRSLLSAVLQIDKSRLEDEVDLVNYGVDSLTVIALQKTLESMAGQLPAPLFIKFQTIRAIASHLVEHYPDAAEALGSSSTAEKASGAVNGGPAPAGAPAESATVTLLRQVKARGLEDYLGEYGSRFRDNKLTEDSCTTSAAAISGRGTEYDLVHFLVAGKSSQPVEGLAIGAGAPVLVLPAVGLTAPTWLDQLASPLTKRMRFYVLHPPGYGITPPIPDCTTAGVARALMEGMEVLLPERPFHILASCLGCVTASYIALHYPERVASLTLVGAFHNTADMVVGDPDHLSSEEFTQMLLSAVERLKKDFAGITCASGEHRLSATATDALGLVLNSLCANSLIAMRYLNEMLSLRVLDWMPAIQAPMQCIYGTKDLIVSPRHSGEIASAAPHAKSLAIESAGHFPYLTHSPRFNQLFEAFIAEHESAQTRLTAVAGR